MGGWHHLPWGDIPPHFDLLEAFLCMCSWGGLLDFENEEYVVFISYQHREHSPQSYYFYGVPDIMEFLSTGEQLFSLESHLYSASLQCYKDHERTNRCWDRDKVVNKDLSEEEVTFRLNLKNEKWLWRRAEVCVCKWSHKTKEKESLFQ